jgi:hypothetical protein
MGLKKIAKVFLYVKDKISYIENMDQNGGKMENNDKNGRKKQLIADIEQLLNSYDGVNPTSINPTLLEFMDEQTLIQVIDSLLSQKEKLYNLDDEEIAWLDKFKKEIV